MRARLLCKPCDTRKDGSNGVTTCVIVPAYNAAASLAPLITRARALGFEVLVVDDGSNDSTAQVAERAGARVVQSAVNQGKGAALQRGFAEALHLGCDLIITMDADGQHDPEELPRFVRAATEQPQAGLIIGNRMAEVHHMPWLRRWTNRCMSWWLSRAAHQRVPDSQCGFRLMRRAFLSRCRLTSGHFEIESELILEAARLGVPIQSLPIRTVYGDEHSHIHPLRDTIRFVRMLASYRRAHRT